ncbi:hypothetical protein MHYP_G00344290 [Metynnis hypsauchen]
MENDSKENAPSVSGSRRTSASKCSVAGAAARARAVAEAARARAAFAQQELEMKKQKARLDLERASLEASLQALELEKAAAAANAEAEVLEAAAETECEDMRSQRSGVAPLEVRRRTEAYVEQQAEVSFTPDAPRLDTSFPQIKESPVSNKASVVSHTSTHDTRAVYPDTRQSECPPTSENRLHSPRLPISYSHRPLRTLQRQVCSPPKYTSYLNHSPRNNTQSPPVRQSPASDMLDFAKYLARRELPRPRLPNNRAQALSRLHSLRRSLNRNPEMKEQFISFMEKLFENRHAEEAAPLHENAESWYLPIFGVYHPQKPGKIRVVFDSSARESGLSLNDVLLSGPDLNNTLLGVLLRFRKGLIALTADIQQMFYCFLTVWGHVKDGTCVKNRTLQKSWVLPDEPYLGLFRGMLIQKSAQHYKNAEQFQSRALS